MFHATYKLINYYRSIDLKWCAFQKCLHIMIFKRLATQIIAILTIGLIRLLYSTLYTRYRECASHAYELENQNKVKQLVHISKLQNPLVNSEFILMVTNLVNILIEVIKYFLLQNLYVKRFQLNKSNYSINFPNKIGMFIFIIC